MNTKSRKMLCVILAAVLLVIALAAGTLMYFAAKNKKEMQVALVGNNKITLMEIHSGNKIVSWHNNSHNNDYINALMAKTEYFVDAEEMLREAGFQIVDENYTGEVDIDFANLDKDSLLSLLA